MVLNQEGDEEDHVRIERILIADVVKVEALQLMPLEDAGQSRQVIRPVLQMLLEQHLVE